MDKLAVRKKLSLYRQGKYLKSLELCPSNVKHLIETGYSFKYRNKWFNNSDIVIIIDKLFRGN